MSETKKDFTKCFWLGFLLQANFTYAKMQGVGFCVAIQHILRKIWTNDEDYKHALQRHLAPFNMTVAPAPLIMGISIAMEEKAKAYIAEIKRMNKAMNIPEKFDFIKEEDIPTLVKRALKEGNPGYPVPKIMDEKECEKVIRSFME